MRPTRPVNDDDGTSPATGESKAIAVVVRSSAWIAVPAGTRRATLTTSTRSAARSIAQATSTPASTVRAAASTSHCARTCVRTRVFRVLRVL